MAFFTELPKDAEGRRTYTDDRPRVIEAVEERGGVRIAWIELRIDRPAQFVAHQTIGDSAVFGEMLIEMTFIGWLKVEGPARQLTEAEYAQILTDSGVRGWRIEAARRRAGLPPEELPPEEDWPFDSAAVDSLFARHDLPEVKEADLQPGDYTNRQLIQKIGSLEKMERLLKGACGSPAERRSLLSLIADM